MLCAVFTTKPNEEIAVSDFVVANFFQICVASVEMKTRNKGWFRRVFVGGAFLTPFHIIHCQRDAC